MVIPLKVAWYCVIKPVAMIMAVYLLAPYLIPNIQSVVIWWCLLALVMTTRPFLILDQRLAEIVFDLVLAMRAGLLGRLLDGFDRIYKALIKGAETALVRADEALQSRGNDSTIMTAVRVAVSLVWVPVREFSRILFIVMVEPTCGHIITRGIFQRPAPAPRTGLCIIRAGFRHLFGRRKDSAQSIRR